MATTKIAYRYPITRTTSPPKYNYCFIELCCYVLFFFPRVPPLRFKFLLTLYDTMNLLLCFGISLQDRRIPTI